MFKALTILRIVPSLWAGRINAMEQQAQANAFTPCGPTQDKSMGWVPPRGQEGGALVESVNGQIVMRMAIETRTVPSSALDKAVKEAAAKIEETTGRKPGRKEMKMLREDALLALLPQAFPKRVNTWVWIDRAAERIMVDSASGSRVDAAISLLVRSFDQLCLDNLLTNTTPVTAMTQWLMCESIDQLPEHLSIGRQLTLESFDEDHAKVRLENHYLLTDEVRKHITEGKQPTSLAMSYDGTVDFVLTDAMALKKINVANVNAADRGEDVDAFDADVMLATGSLQPLINHLVEAMGGILERAQAGSQDATEKVPA